MLGPAGDAVEADLARERQAVKHSQRLSCTVQRDIADVTGVTYVSADSGRLTTCSITD